MELELGLKITRDAEEQGSTEFHIAKDGAGPVFVSTETDSVFILSAHLKGFEKENMKINISDDGTRITISGEKLVSETMMRGWRVYKREDEVRGFRKSFKIPDGVLLDGIKAKFGTDNSSLTIYMPKSDKGISGHQIQQVKEEDEDGNGTATTTRSEALKPHADAETSASNNNSSPVVENKAGFFPPTFFMGSALIASLLVLVVGFVRAKTQ